MRTLPMAILTILTASAPAAAQCSDVEKTKLKEFDLAWGEASTGGNRAHLLTVYADDYAGTTPTGTLGKATTIDNAVRQAERAKASTQPAPKVTYDNFIITCTPVTALVTHRNANTTTMGGREQTSYSRSVHVMEKRGGRWQVVGNAGHALDDAAVLLYMENDWNEAARKHDAAWFERNYAAGATEISARTGGLQTKSEVVASMKTDKAVLDSLGLSEMSVRVDGDVAVVTGVNHVKGRDEQGKAFNMRARFTDTFIRRDGRWQVWATQSSIIP